MKPQQYDSSNRLRCQRVSQVRVQFRGSVIPTEVEESASSGAIQPRRDQKADFFPMNRDWRSARNDNSQRTELLPSSAGRGHRRGGMVYWRGYTEEQEEQFEQ